MIRQLTDMEKSIINKNRSIRIKVFKNDFYWFCEYYFGSNFYYPHANYHHEYCHSLTQWKNVLFIGHRESVKTTFARRYIVRCIVYTKHPFILFGSFESGKAGENLFYVAQELQDNERIVSDFGQLFLDDTPNKDKKKKGIKTRSAFIANNGVYTKATSVGATTRGLNHSFNWVSVRPSLYVWDDLDVEKSVSNSRIVEKNYNFLKSEVFGGMPWNSQKVILWNIIKQDGVINRLESDYTWSTFRDIYRVPTISNNWTKTIIRNKEINNQWEFNWDRFVHTKEEADRLNKEFAKDKWDFTIKPFVSLEYLRFDLWPTSFWQNHLLVPMVDGDTIIKKHMMKYVSDRRNKTHVCHNVMGIDPAFSTKTMSDMFGICCTMHMPNSTWESDMCVMFSEWLKWPEKEERKVVARVVELYNRFNIDMIEIEWNNGWEIIWNLLKQEGLAVNISHSSQDKVTRLKEHERLFSNWFVYFVTWENKELEDQLLKFPNDNFDDIVDAMVMSFKRSANIWKVNRQYNQIKKSIWERKWWSYYSQMGWKF